MDDGVRKFIGTQNKHPSMGVPNATGKPVPLAKPAKGEYRRNLPHLQADDKPIYLTFCTHKRWELPEGIRRLVIKHCLHDHGVKLLVHGVVVMPDHVHMIFSTLCDPDGNVFGLTEIISGIKGSSAHSINKTLKRRGPVWQREYFDHVLRSDEKIREKVEYICQNPVRKGLVENESDYPWLWREWVEGENVAPPPPAAPK
jgi:REP element-mobilizing transposase RayT